MELRSFTVGRFLTNCHVVTCSQTRLGIVIDPGFEDADEATQILTYIAKNVKTLKYIVNTHGHLDHSCGNAIVKARFHSPILIHEKDNVLLGESNTGRIESLGFRNFSPNADELLQDNDDIAFGQVSFRVIHTPGHTHGSVTLVGSKVAFTGDTLFANSIGRTDFPESSPEDMSCSLEKLKKLNDETAVYPGHGPATTIGDEKKNNPFL